MTDTATGGLARAAALHALLAGNTPGQEAPAPVVQRTGVTVEAGGDVERVLIAVANLTYRSGEYLYRAAAEVGDLVLVTQDQADRLDKLGATVDPAKLDELDADVQRIDATLDSALATAPAPGVTLKTDEELKALKAAELVAYVGQHPDERARVRTLEEARGPVSSNGRGARNSVLNATKPTPEEDAEVEARVAAQREADEAAKLAADAAKAAGEQAPAGE
jgi:hypothetical protein